MSNNTFYKPSGKVKDLNRTYVPDLYRQVVAEMNEEERGTVAEERYVKLQNRPLVGVLYSISASNDGELFPIYVGRNTIGCDPSCDICLRESSVSSIHGLLLARKQTNDIGEDYINVSLSDNNSIYGTAINGEKLSYEKVECSDGDMITIGQNYEFVLSLFNAINKLSVSSDFERIEEPETDSEPDPKFEKPAEDVADIMPTYQSANHSTNIAIDHEGNSGGNFYRPSKKMEGNHYNNKTIIQ